jgi:hypothetical protein
MSVGRRASEWGRRLPWNVIVASLKGNDLLKFGCSGVEGHAVIYLR